MTAEDFGHYSCQATNSHGSANQTVELVQSTLPIPEAAYGGAQHTGLALLAILLPLALAAML